MKTIILKNITTNDITINSLGLTILKNDFILIDNSELNKFSMNDELFSLIDLNLIKVNDGTTDLNPSDAKIFLQPVAENIFSLVKHSHDKSEINNFSHSHDDVYFTKEQITSTLTNYYTKQNTEEIFSLNTHNHDSIYYKKSEIDSNLYTRSQLKIAGQSEILWDNIISKPSTFTPTLHSHDDIYYTKSESDDKYSTISHSHNKSDILDFSESSYVHTIGDETISGTKIFIGDVIFNGTTTIVNSQTIHLSDNIILLNSDCSESAPTENAGIEIKRGTELNASLIWDESLDKWKAGLSGFEVEISLLGHSHDDRYYTKSESDTKYSIISHSHDDFYTKLDMQTSGSAQLHWDNIISKPSTFTPSLHSHDDKYYTKNESDSKYSTISHSHDDRYYTKSWIDSSLNLYYTKLNMQTSGLAQLHWNNITSKPSTFTPSLHAHDDKYYTKNEINSSFANITHTHDDRYYTENEINSKLSQINIAFVVSNDTTTDITSAELETLTNGSNADALHTHSNTGSGTLDQAYGAWGVGRTITVDWGSVQLDAINGFAPLKLTPINYVPNQWLGGGEICVKDNELYLYDSTRNSFLSVSTVAIQWASNSNNVSGYIFYGAAQTNSKTGFVAPKNGKIIGISAVAQNYFTGASISIMINRYNTQEVWWQNEIINLQNLNININPGDIVNLYLKGSGNSKPNKPCITLFIKNRL